VRSLRLHVTPLVPAGARLPVLDELKGLGLVLVLLYHGGGVLGLPNVLHGEIGVDLFLIVSGFALAISSVELSLDQFFQRRFLRIFPAYWLALGLFLWMHHKYLGVTYSAPNIWLHIVGLHAFGPPGFFSAISDSFWFIAMIVPAYLVFALLRRHLDNLSLLVAVCGLLTAITCEYYLRTVHVGGLTHLAVRIPSFFIGIIAGRLLGTGTMEVRFNFLLGLGLLCFYYITFIRSGVVFGYPLPAVGIIVTWVALRHVLGRIAPGRWILAGFSGLGLISYEIYLFHQPLIRDYNLFVYHVWLGNLAPTPAQIVRGMLLALALTVVISLAVHAATARLFGRRRASRSTAGAT
jgi:peptidoglycan/LPS O-acetylase OafA/YrhL